MFNFRSVIQAGDTHTITYDLRNGWFISADIVLIDLFDYSWAFPLEVTIWKLNTPGDGINLWYGNPLLFYALPVPARTDGIFWNLERVEIGSLRPTKVHETWQCQVCNKKVSQSCKRPGKLEISESYFCARSNFGNRLMTSPSRISSEPPPKLQRKKNKLRYDCLVVYSTHATSVITS